MKVSIILPSIRKNKAEEFVANYVTALPDFDYEIVVISPFAISGEKVVHVLDDKCSGVVYPANLGLKASSGDYIMYLCDDIYIDPLNLPIAYEFACTIPNPSIVTFGYNDIGINKVHDVFAYDRICACVGLVSRITLDQIGGYIAYPEYKHFNSDIDISMRIWDAGGQVAICPDINALCEPSQNNDHSMNKIYWGLHKKHDDDLLISTWHTKYGNGKTTFSDISYIKYR